MIPRYKGKFKHDWEEPYLERSKAGMFKNTFADIEYILTTCAGNNTRFEIECYDIGHLYTLRAFPRPRPGQAAAVRAVGVRHSRRHRRAPRRRHHDEAHRRPAARRQLSLVGAGRRRQPDAGRRHGGRDGRQRARRHGGFAVDRRRQARRIERRSRSRRCARSSRGSASRSPAPTRRARSSRSRAATRSGFDGIACQRQRFSLLLHARNPPIAEGDLRDGLARYRQSRDPARQPAGAGRHPVEPDRVALRRAAAAGVSPGRHAGRRGRAGRHQVRRRRHRLYRRLDRAGADPVRRRLAHALRHLPQRAGAVGDAGDRRRADHRAADRAGRQVRARHRLDCRRCWSARWWPRPMPRRCSS